MLGTIKGVLTGFGLLAISVATIALLIVVAFLGAVVGLGLGLSLLVLVLPLALILAGVFLVTRFIHTE